jgi:hypothetical protein
VSSARPASSYKLLRMFLSDMTTAAIFPGKAAATNSTAMGQRSPMHLRDVARYYPY